MKLNQYCDTWKNITNSFGHLFQNKKDMTN